MADQQTAKLAEPRIGSFDDPATFVAPQLAAVVYLRSLLLFR